MKEGTIVSTQVIMNNSIKYTVIPHSGFPGETYHWIDDTDLSKEQCERICADMVGETIEIPDKAVKTYKIGKN